MSDPDFTDFYRAVHRGRDPFPWQRRLAETVAETGWPSDIGVPTGLGKTSTLDIAVWALARQAERPAEERTLPTRIWYVVNRRLLVDAASDHAEHLARLLANPDTAHSTIPDQNDSDLATWRQTLHQVADRLRSISITDGCAFELSDGERTCSPLFVSRLRGGAMPGYRPPHPIQPSIICATVPMYGSRLLFRGYGASNRMWPIDAALAGTDSLVLLDEAHLSRPLQALVEGIKDCDANQTGILRPFGRHKEGLGVVQLLPPARAYPTLVSLSATGDESETRFDLDAADLEHPIVRQRLTAAKPARLVETDRKQLPKCLAGELVASLAALERPAAAVVFVNSPSTAREVRDRLNTTGARRKGDPVFDLVVLTGQVRDIEADLIRRRLLDPETGAPSGGPSGRERSLVVIATQTLEVGADLDFDVLITETAGVRALTQRLGRLNRLGTKPHAVAVLCHPADAKADGLYGDERNELWTRLSRLDQPLDLSPSSIADVLGPPTDDPGAVAELLPCHLWEFAKTSNPPEGAAPAEVFFDVTEEERRVSVCWRAHVPGDGEPPLPSPGAGEFVDVPVGELKLLLERSGSSAARITLDASATTKITTEAFDAEAIRPGQQIILPASAGGYGPHGWDPEHAEEVLDLSPLLTATLSLTNEAVTNLLGDQLSEEQRLLLAALNLDSEDEPDPAADEEAGREVLAWLSAAGPPVGIPAVAWAFASAVNPVVTRIGVDRRAVMTWRLEGCRIESPRVDALDELSIAPTQFLDNHLQSVGELAEQIACRLGMSSDIATVVGDAGRFHDLGKADRRFQLLLGHEDGELVAKSDVTTAQWRRAQDQSGWPRGGRHELLSIQLVDAAIEAGVSIDDPDLVRHLVITHHGHGRPLCTTTSTGGPLPTTATVKGIAVTTTTDTRCDDWRQPERFRVLCERYGYWGVALLETVLRQADHQVSAMTPDRKVTVTTEVQ